MPDSRSEPRLSATDRAELEMLRDVAKRLIGFDGGAEVMSWEAAHRRHRLEPYIGCPFCRDKFARIGAPPEIDDAAVESVMLDLMAQSVEVVSRFNRPLRDQYMDDLRSEVRKALARAFDADARVVAHAL